MAHVTVHQNDAFGADIPQQHLAGTAGTGDTSKPGVKPGSRPQEVKKRNKQDTGTSCEQLSLNKRKHFCGINAVSSGHRETKRWNFSSFSFSFLSRTQDCHVI